MEGFFIRQLVAVIVVSYYIGKGAKRAGYSRMAWCLVAFFGGPLLAMMLLTGLANRTNEIARERERELLKHQLEKRSSRSAIRGSMPMDRTISGDVTLR